MYKTLAVHVDDSPHIEARVRAAAQLADGFGARVMGCAATGMSWPALVMLAGSLHVEPRAQFDAIRAQARERLARFAERARAAGMAAPGESLVEEESRVAMLLQSRYADLVITGQPADEVPPLDGLPQYLALHGPRPVLVVPRQYAGAPLTGNIVIGWNGSTQAIRAIDAALPLLQRAAGVRLVMVAPGPEAALNGLEPGAAMAQYLAGHGVRAELVHDEGRLPAGDALLEAAQSWGAGLLVAGAFGHSRLRELVLGGATRLLLERAPVPVLFAH